MPLPVLVDDDFDIEFKFDNSKDVLLNLKDLQNNLAFTNNNKEVINVHGLIGVDIIQFVAEEISYFCLARNLIRPLGSTHNFTQSGWLILFNGAYFRAAQTGEAAKHPLSQNFFVQYRSLTFCSSIAAAELTQWGKQSNLWIPCVYFS